jgi:putative hydroxymethylpyrimidine transport system substrate-binding protein
VGACAALLGCFVALLLAGCGSSSSTTTNASQSVPPASSSASHAPAAQASAGSSHPAKATLILDFVPNAVHAGIYRALAAGYYRQQGIELRIIQPSATTDPLKLIDAGSAQFGLADGSDVAGLIAAGGDAQAVMALLQRPVGGLIGLASEHLRTPADLQGKTVGITGVPSDRAVLDTEVAQAGGDPRKVHVVTIGFNGAQALAAGKIAAFTGFIPADGVQLQVSGRPITAFALDRYGGPAYPGLVAFTTRREVASDPALVRGFVAATVHGYEDTLADPKPSLQELLAANPTLQRTFTQASLAAYLPLFEGQAKVPFGTLQARNIEALSDWMFANHLVSSAVPPARYGTNRFLP